MTNINGGFGGGYGENEKKKKKTFHFGYNNMNNMHQLYSLSIFVFLSVLVIGGDGEKKVVCLQCGGDKYEGNVRLSRDTCCSATPVICQNDQVCLRALVYSPYGNFFLSGCHPKEENLSGCDFHTLPHNSSVHRCVCSDEECQNGFPGDCPIKGITDDIKPQIFSNSLTTPSPHSSAKKVTPSSPPSLIARVNRTRGHSSNSPRNRHHHSHSTNSSCSTLFYSIVVISLLVFCV